MFWVPAGTWCKNLAIYLLGDQSLASRGHFYFYFHKIPWKVWMKIIWFLGWKKKVWIFEPPKKTTAGYDEILTHFVQFSNWLYIIWKSVKSGNAGVDTRDITQIIESIETSSALMEQGHTNQNKLISAFRFAS